MKKLITTTFTFSLFVISFAQTHYGIKAGYNNSIMRFEYGKLDSRSSFYLGGFLENKIGEKISLQSEINYTELGGKSSTEVTKIVGSEIVELGTANYKYINRQIQVPVIVKYNILPKFNLLGGLNFGFNISSEFKTDFVSDFMQSGNTKFFKSINMFPIIGTEYYLSDNFFTEARYNFGVFNVAKKDAINTYFNSFQIGLGYKFQ